MFSGGTPRAPVGSAGNSRALADHGRVHVGDEDGFLVGALDEDIPPRRDDCRVSGVAQPAAFAGAVDARDVAEVLDRPGAQKGAPRLSARLRPVRDDGEEIRVLGGEAKQLGKRRS